MAQNPDSGAAGEAGESGTASGGQGSPAEAPCPGGSQPGPETPRLSILEEALSLTAGSRQSSYAHPLGNFQAIAEFWGTWLWRRHGVQVNLDHRDVAWMMAMLKAAREAGRPQRDNMVDAAGYLRCLEMCDEEEARRANRPKG